MSTVRQTQSSRRSEDQRAKDFWAGFGFGVVIMSSVFLLWFVVPRLYGLLVSDIVRSVSARAQQQPHVWNTYDGPLISHGGTEPEPWRSPCVQK